MQINHYNPIGPFYLYATFNYSIYSISTKNGRKRKFVKYAFKRAERKCQTSVIFTTIGLDFQKLKIIIAFYLYREIDSFAIFEYTFHKGFNQKIYELISYSQNFKVYVKVINESKNYLDIPKSLNEDDRFYLKSNTAKNECLCVMANNNPVILYPDYRSNSSYGFIYSLHAMIFSDEIYVGKRDYPAFACYKDESYPNISTIFIIDGDKNSITFSILYKKHFKDPHGYIKEFVLSNPKYGYVRNLERVPVEYSKVFLIKIHFYILKCEDKSEPKVFYANNNIYYSIYFKKKIEILPFVECKIKFYRSPENPCGKLKKRLKTG